MSATPDENLALDNFFSASLTSDITSTSTDIPMDAIPNAAQGFLVIDPDSASNREIIFYNSKTSLKVTVPSVADGRGQGSTTAASHTSGTTVIMAYTSGILAALQSLAAMTLDAKGGWVPAAGEGESWSYSSYDSTNKTGVITVPSDATTQMSVGMRVRFTNNSSTQYGIITALTATTLTVYFGTQYSLTNAAITVPYYSPWKAPLGFPLDPAKWTVEVSNSSSASQSSPTQNTWYNAGTISINIPIGTWRVYYEGQGGSTRGSAGYCVFYSTLSTANNSESDSDFSCLIYVNNATDFIDYVRREKPLSLSSATTYYMNIKTDQTSQTAIKWNGEPLKIRAVCAYL